MAISTHKFCKATHLYLSSLLDELSIDERDSDRFNSRLVVCRSSDSSCKLLDWLITADCRLSTTLLGFTVIDLLIWYARATITQLRAIKFLWLLFRVYFRIMLKRGQTHSSKCNFKAGGTHILQNRESQFPRGGGAKAPPGPPEINPALGLVVLLLHWLSLHICM
jgi:hypothetical protein